MSEIELTLRNRTTSLKVEDRTGFCIRSRIMLEDESGFILTEDGNYIGQETGDEGTSLTLRDFNE